MFESADYRDTPACEDELFLLTLLLNTAASHVPSVEAAPLETQTFHGGTDTTTRVFHSTTDHFPVL